MNQDQIYEAMRSKQRGGTAPLEALSYAMTLAGATVLTKEPSEDHLFIHAEGMLRQSINIIDFLAYSINYTWTIQSAHTNGIHFTTEVPTTKNLSGAYIKVYKDDRQ